MVTIRDIAKRAGVSVSTASRHSMITRKSV
ncbi:LacI family DNA-binding transcriptional regulator [Secundilactobacillus similis]